MDTTNLTPLDLAICSCAKKDMPMEFPDGRSPSIIVTDHQFSYSIFLRDHPDIFAQVGPRAYTLTAKARRRFAEILEETDAA